MNLSFLTEIPQIWEYGKRNPFKTAGIYRQKARLLSQLESPQEDLQNRNYSLRDKIAEGINKMCKNYILRSSGFFLSLKDKIANRDINIPLYNRFNTEYLERQKDKLYSLHWRHPPRFFVTITIDYSQYNSIYAGYKEMGKEWNRLLSRLKKKDANIQFLKIYEIQEKNTKNVHIHALLQSNLSFNKIAHGLSLLKICQVWDISDLAGYFYQKNNRLPSNHELYYMSQKYILKYISKGIKDFDIDNIPENNSILWSLGARTFSFSRGMYRQGKKTPLDFAYETNSNFPALGFFGYHLKKFFGHNFMSFKSHMFYEIQTSRYEFIKIFRDYG